MYLQNEPSNPSVSTLYAVVGTGLCCGDTSKIVTLALHNFACVTISIDCACSRFLNLLLCPLTSIYILNTHHHIGHDKTLTLYDSC